MPRVVHVKERIPGAIFIGRPGPYGNPFIIGRHGTRQEIIHAYHSMLLKSPALLGRVKKELVGKDLACFCAPLPCHGDVLIALANGKKYNPLAWSRGSPM